LQLRQTHFTDRQAKLADFESHVANYAGGSTKVQEKQSLSETIKSLENKLKTLTDPQEKELAVNMLTDNKGHLDKILAYEQKVNDELELERKVERTQDGETMPNALKSCEDIRRACKNEKRNEVIKDALGSFWQVLGEICKESYPPTDNIVDTLKNLAQTPPGTANPGEKDELCPPLKQQDNKNENLKTAPAKTTEQNLATALHKLNDLINLLAVRYDLLVEQTNLSQDELIFHIRMMRLSAQEQEVLLHSGITGLATYEAGGIKPEDVANVIHTAQTLATAAIAARVK
jgi:hypothetical protein